MLWRQTPDGGDDLLDPRRRRHIGRRPFEPRGLPDVALTLAKQRHDLPVDPVDLGPNLVQALTRDHPLPPALGTSPSR